MEPRAGHQGYGLLALPARACPADHVGRSAVSGAGALREMPRHGSWRSGMLRAMTRINDTPPAWDDRTQLTTFLDYVRGTARAKCEGVSEENARKALLPGSPLMTMSGVINHLRWVEYYWFQVVFLGEEDRAPMTDEDPDREMRIAVDFPLAQLLDEYAEQSSLYRELVAGSDLDKQAQRTIRNGVHVDLRWIMHHLTEETARHNGHLDILREMLDGTTGH
jgi:uncharacterized damage-inducible protein DinB